MPVKRYFHLKTIIWIYISKEKWISLLLDMSLYYLFNINFLNYVNKYQSIHYYRVDGFVSSNPESCNSNVLLYLKIYIDQKICFQLKKAYFGYCCVKWQ